MIGSTNAIGGGQKLLWTNSSPTSSFTAQTVSVDLSKFDWFVITARRVTSSAQMTTTVAHKGETTMMYGVPQDGNPSYLAVRRIAITDTGATFSEAYMNGTQDDARVVPYQIYGVR